jgi:hypothetical protein
MPRLPMISALRLLLLTPIAALALDLNPMPTFKELEGVKIPQIQFKDGSGRVLWSPPRDWRTSYEEGRLVLIPKDRTHAAMELRVIPRVGTDQEVLTTAEKVAKYAGTFLPKASTDVVMKSTNDGPFTIGPLGAKEYLLDFQEPGHPSKASFNVINLNDRERLLVIITAQPKDFDDVRSVAIQSMFSWQVE